MPTVRPVCSQCGVHMREAIISLDVSGIGFTMTISGVPVYACDDCLTSLIFANGMISVDEVITAVVSALDKITPSGYGTPTHSPRQCMKCKANLPDKIDRNRAHFMSNSPLGPGRHIIGIEYYGDSLTCPMCAQKHPYLTSVTWHQLADAIRRASRLYLR